MSVLKRT